MGNRGVNDDDDLHNKTGLPGKLPRMQDIPTVICVVEIIFLYLAHVADAKYIVTRWPKLTANLPRRRQNKSRDKTGEVGLLLKTSSLTLNPNLNPNPKPKKELQTTDSRCIGGFQILWPVVY